MSNEMDMTKLGFFGRIRKFFWKFALIKVYYSDDFQHSYPDCDIEIWNLMRSLSSLPQSQERRNLTNCNIKFGGVTLSFDPDGDLYTVEVDTHRVYVSKETRKFITSRMVKLMEGYKKEESKGVETSLKNSIQSTYLETKGL